MKNKKLFLPTIILVAAILLSMISTLVTCVSFKPNITEHEFPFTITYELDGKTITINNVYKAWYVKDNNKERYYEGEISDMGEGTTHYVLKSNKKGRIELSTQFYADYMMGDAEYDYFDSFEPIIYYYDSDGYEYSDLETLEKQGVKLISFEYPEPIENSFKFSHIAIPDSDIVFPSLVIALLALAATLIFVKKEAEYVRKPVDIVSVIFNFLISFTVLPYLTVCAYLLDALGDAGDFLNYVFFSLPAITVLSITASIGLRRKSYGKSSLFVQFISPAIFGVIMLVGACLGLL